MISAPAARNTFSDAPELRPNMILGSVATVLLDTRPPLGLAPLCVPP